jgi:hypothetical protein
MFSPSSNEQCFGILYLMFENYNQVTLDYGLCFSTLETINTTFDAKWSGSL